MTALLLQQRLLEEDGQLPHRSPPSPQPSPGPVLTFSGSTFSAAGPTLPARDCLVVSTLALRGSGILSLGLCGQAGDNKA